MSVAIGFNISQNPGCGSLTFEDISVYGSNYSEITGTTIVFNLSNGETVTFTDFIPTAENNALTIYAADLGYEDEIPDQITTITYTVFTDSGDVLGLSSVPVYLSCQFLSCFNGQITKAASIPGCSAKDLDRLANLWMRYLGIQSSTEQNAGCVEGSLEDLTFTCCKFCLQNC